MILHGNQRGGAKGLALHLLSDENEHIEIHHIKGFVSGDLMGALQESYALSRGTKCRQHLFSLSMNPPPDAKVSTSVFEEALSKVEKELNLKGKPRVMVFHEKKGRRHAHVVWSRIDGQSMKAVPLPFSKCKLMDISREIYIRQGWTMPQGMMEPGAPSQTNYTLAQWQQAKRAGKDPKKLKAMFQQVWASSPDQNSFASALEQNGYVLAKGDRRSFVAVDFRGEVFAIAKWTGAKTKLVREKLHAPETLPSVEEAQKTMAAKMSAQLEQLKLNHQNTYDERFAALENKKQAMVQSHQKERLVLKRQLGQMRQQEAIQYQKELKRGLKGLWQRLTGDWQRILSEIQRRAFTAARDEQAKMDNLIFR